ncbi:EF-hand calcium-binding domain-containing protein 3 [Dromaius novaehollandiae]|uniref:EF-hand calcium-binding domain-containing protein 3 n=1 Tax=Dromaius novaehollandiae TaxID=8790 RepID=UPI00311EC314
MQEVLQHVTVDADGKVNLSEFMYQVKTAQSTAQGASQYAELSAEEDDAKMPPREDNQGTLTHPSEEKYVQSSKELDKETTGRYMPSLPAPCNLLSSPCLSAAFCDAFNFFPKDPDGNINLHSLQVTAEELGISLTSQEANDELVYADADRDGKVNFSDFLTTVTDKKRFMQAMVPDKNYTGNSGSVKATGILLFEVLSKLVELAALPQRSLLEIVRYYQQKFVNCTGQKAWKDSDSLMYCRKKRCKIRKDQAYVSSFVNAARISFMNDKDLIAYVESLKACVPLSDSPYAQVPIFPLIPKQEAVIAGRPKQDLQKLERQRRNEPIASFEKHFFHKRNWMQEMKRAMQLYRQDLALHERARLLKLWRRIRGGQIGLETGSERFHHTFSVYSWSWNVCQELVTPSDLRKADNELYRRPRGAGTQAKQAAAPGKGAR